jgi:hypothetical protein
MKHYLALTLRWLKIDWAIVDKEPKWRKMVTTCLAKNKVENPVPNDQALISPQWGWILPFNVIINCRLNC